MKTAIFISMLFVVSVACAQYRNVILPESPKSTKYKDYTSEGATPFWFSLETQGISSVMEKRKNMQAVDLTFTGGYRFSEYIRVGLGFGGRAYVNNNEVRNSEHALCFPIFANARGNFISAQDRDGVPFWSVNVGGITNDGAFFNPTIGYSFGGLRNNFLIGLSYSIGAFKNSDDKNTTYSFCGIKLGYEF